MPIMWLAGALLRRLAGTIVISAIGALTYQMGLWACFGWAGVSLGPYTLLAGPACPA
jgi:hypothetical protein